MTCDYDDQLDPDNTAHPLEWAIETDIDPHFMIADWLVRDLLEEDTDAVTILSSNSTALDQFRTLKRAFKHLRTQGETPADRRLGARLYAATIAAAMVRHDRRITVQSDRKLREAFDDFARDLDMPESLAALVKQARSMIGQGEVDS